MLKKKKRKFAHRSKDFIPSTTEQSGKGSHFDLQAIFDELNRKYFNNKLSDYKVCWMRSRKQRPRNYIVFGTIQEESKTIRINRHLDQEFVPKIFLQFVLYHEMLHTKVKDEFVNGRRIVHSKKFLDLEKQSPFYAQGAAWEAKNTDRFFRT